MASVGVEESDQKSPETSRAWNKDVWTTCGGRDGRVSVMGGGGSGV